ncbi:MAG: RHS repeat-associated core domain-containing protein, partial [Pirellulales bacterium]
PVTDYEYYDVGWVKKVTEPDPDGDQGPLPRATTEYVYDGRGRITSVTRPNHLHDGQMVPTVTTTTYTYSTVSGEGLLETVTDAEGHVTKRQYDTLGQLILLEEADPDGPNQPLTSPQTRYAYDDLGRVVQMTDPRNQVTDYQYELVANIAPAGAPAEPGLRVTRTDPSPDGVLPRPVTVTGYDKEGRLRFVTDPLSHVTEYQYDGADRLEKLIEPDPDGPTGPLLSPVTTYAYDKVGNLRFVTDPRSTEGNPIVTETVYDNLNRPKTRIMPAVGGVSPTYNYTYYATGQLATETDPLQHVTSYEYDTAGRTTKVTQPDPDGTGSLRSPTTISTYDGVGNLKTVKALSSNGNDDDGFTTTYEYDALGNLILATDAVGHTHYSYDGVGNRLTLIDPDNNQTTWTYDGLNRVKTETNQLTLARQFEYDAAGNLLKRTDRNGRVIEYVYDNLSRRTHEYWKDGQNTIRTIGYGYDAAGRMETAGDDLVGSYSYGYDNLDRKTSITQTMLSGLTVPVLLGQKYDAGGNRTQLAATIGTAADLVNDYQYDNVGRMRLVTQGTQTGGNVVAPKRVEFGYDAASRPQTTTRYAALTQDDLVATTYYAFDDASRLTGMVHVLPGTPVQALSYAWTFDRAGRITQQVNSTDGTADYTQDDTGQLTSADYTYLTPGEAYQYDANGNRINNGYTVDPNNRLKSDGTKRYEYDNEGNRTKRFTWYDLDADGVVDNGERFLITEYTWDYRNRLTSVVDRGAEGLASTQVVNYTYDVFNRLVARWIDPDGDNGTTEPIRQTAFVYDGDQILLQFEQVGLGNLDGGDLKHRYLWGPAVDQILADETVASLLTAGDVLWPLTDHLGSVRDLAHFDPLTDTTTVVRHQVYDAFGNLRWVTGLAECLFGFTGRMYDTATKLQNNLHRSYDATVGRWLSEDPIGFNAGDANLSRYVGNNPLRRTDPSGLMPRDALPCDAQAWTIANAACQAQTPPANFEGPPKVRCGMKYSVDLFRELYLKTVYYECIWKPKCMCSKEELGALNAAVSAACDGANSGRRCYRGMLRDEALENARRFSACEAARNAINQKCFSGGDSGHQEAARNARRASAYCIEIAEHAPPPSGLA